MHGSISKQAMAALNHAIIDGMLYKAETISMQRALNRLCGIGLAVRPLCGFYASKSAWEALSASERYLMALRSLASIHPAWVFCSYSAAAIHGIDVPYAAMGQIHIVATRTGRHGQVYQHHLRNPKIELISNIQVTALEQTVASCIDRLVFPLALGVADAALRIKNWTPEELLTAVATLQGRGVDLRYVSDVISYGDKRSENGGESYARAIMIEQGVMMPELQVEHYDPISQSRYRDDFEWRLRQHVVAGELDGIGKYTRIARADGKDIENILREERQRESRLRNQGLQFARFTFEQVKQVKPFLAILDSCGIPRIGPNNRAPRA